MFRNFFPSIQKLFRSFTNVHYLKSREPHKTETIKKTSEKVLLKSMRMSVGKLLEKLEKNHLIYQKKHLFSSNHITLRTPLTLQNFSTTPAQPVRNNFSPTRGNVSKQITKISAAEAHLRLRSGRRASP